MYKVAILAVVLCAAAFAYPTVAQKRASEKKVVSFVERVDNAKRAWEGEAYGTCSKELQGMEELFL